MASTNSIQYILPEWLAPESVTAACSLRVGGASAEPFCANVALHVDDCAETVLQNRAKLLELLQIQNCSWLEQVHGTAVVEASKQLQTADAVITRESGIACAVMTADCLPILITDTVGAVVAALHCGWRSLAGGIVERTIEKMGEANGEWFAWLGPAIGPDQFEVGQDVFDSFKEQPWFINEAFKATSTGKYLADLYALARSALAYSGVSKVYGGEYCTVTNNDLFFSFRKEKTTGRMVSLIQINP